MKKYLALDVGGTKTHIALFSVDEAGDILFKEEKKYSTQGAQNIEEILLDFYPEMEGVEGICLAIAGPIINDSVQLTNVLWKVEKESIRKATGVSNVLLLNDLEASAFGIPYMKESDLLSIFKAEEEMAGNIAIIAPGTGLGEAAMYWDGQAYHPFASEGGHCDFSPRDNKDVNLLMFLQHKFGRVSWERVVSGQGIVNIFDFLRTSVEYNLEAGLEERLLAGDVAANISQAAVDGEPVAIDAMKLFVRYLAVESANMALKFKSTGGLFIGGGIIPKIWNKEYQDIFLAYFFNVGRLAPLLRCMDVTIILNPVSVLFGAAHYLISKN
ncbi:MAG: ROK family protein [Bacteroidota bacterium]